VGIIGKCYLVFCSGAPRRFGDDLNEVSTVIQGRLPQSTTLFYPFCGVRTTAGMQEVEQRMEQLPSRKSVSDAG